MDTHVFGSLAQVQILLVPIGTLSRISFEKYASDIRSFESIRLGDIPAGGKDLKARFMPNPLSTGYMHLSYVAHPPPHSHAPLTLLRPSHFPLAIIGIASCSDKISLKSTHAQFNATLLHMFPTRSVFPLAKSCFVFEENDVATNLNVSDLPDMVILPSMMGNKKLYIGTLLADLCSHILEEFGVVVQTLESPLGNEYLNSAVLPVLPPLSEILSPLDQGSRNEPPPTFRQSTLNVQPPKKRISTIGTASSFGRLYKALGDFSLLAGKTEDSTVWYTEAVQLLRNSQDHIWHASALEGLATVSVVEAWSTVQGSQTSSSAVKEIWIDISEKLIQATSLYYKYPSLNDMADFNSLLAYLYCSCVLRHSSLMFSIWSAKGWGSLAFTTMLHSSHKPYLPPALASDKNLGLNSERMSHISGISRSSISNILSSIHGPWLLHLGSRDRITILEVIASMYSSIGYKRKEAYILREVLGCIMDLMVCGRDRDDSDQTPHTPSGSGLAIQTSTLSSEVNWGTVGIRLNEATDGNGSILRVLKFVCRVFGINLDAVSLVDPDATLEIHQGSNTTITQYDNEAVEEYQEPYGWPELQVGVVREAVAIAEALPDFPAVAQFALSSLKTLRSVLSIGDQYHFYSTSTRALMTARRRGYTSSVEYWSGRPVISVAVVELPLIRLPAEKPVSAMHSKPSGMVPLLQGITDPFLYNPRKATAEKQRAIVVQNEQIEFIVHLQNLFLFDLEIQSLTLSTTGVDFESQPMRVIIPASSMSHQVVLAGRALQPGLLVIRGCIIQTSGGAKREYILPLSTREADERLARKRSALACEIGRAKYTGLNCFPWAKEGRHRISGTKEIAGTSVYRFLECKVAPEQPLLRIRRTTVTHGALMLYDGERSTLRITLENESSLRINFLHLAFDDSTIAPAQQALTEANMSVFETYETEYRLINNPLLSWDESESKEISPGKFLTLTLNCFGKVGCTSGAVHISYSHIDPSHSEASNMFYTRQLSYPLLVTVYHMLECGDMDIHAFPSYSLETNDAGSEKHQKELYVDDETGWCLFSVQVRNTYGSPFDVTFERTQDTISSASTTTTIPPGSTARLMIPIKKIILSEDQISKPIPTLSERQFVVTKSGLSAAENRRQRELFWYREALIECVQGHWKETGGIRTGTLSLREQRMTWPMLETFRLEAAKVQMGLNIASDETSLRNTIIGTQLRYYLQPNKFVSLLVTVTNLSTSSLVFTMDVDIKPARYVVHDGILSDVAIGRLESGEGRDVSLTVCFLALGRFDISARVTAFGVPYMEGRAAVGHLVAIVEAD